MSTDSANLTQAKAFSRGRPRDKDVDTRILQAALNLVEQHGFRAVTVEVIAEEAAVAKTTIYRRWPGKAAIVMDALLTVVEPEIGFPEGASPLESLRKQMSLLAQAFRSNRGVLVRSLLAEAQFDPELKTAFLERWILKRRAIGTSVIRAAIDAGELAADTDPEMLLDALYGGLYYWLLIGTLPPTEGHVESLWRTVMAPKTR
jgi:AcrR family transcriptional regulator